ncbi:hypothetical protein GCM10027159_24630 [Lysobacter terrae]
MLDLHKRIWLARAMNRRRLSGGAMLVGLAALAACTEAVPDLTTYVHMSHRFGVCMRPLEGASYRLISHGIDSDDGEFVLADARIETQVTYNQPFDAELPSGEGPAFRYMGMQRLRGEDHLLLGYEAEPNGNETYVVFIAPDLSEAEPILRAQDFVVTCEGAMTY